MHITHQAVAGWHDVNHDTRLRERRGPPSRLLASLGSDRGLGLHDRGLELGDFRAIKFRRVVLHISTTTDGAGVRKL